MKVICISGKAGAGKDTCGRIFNILAEQENKEALIIHFGDLVKFMASSFFDWDGEKDAYGRRLLQTIGTDIVRAEDPDYWVKFVVQVLKFFPNKWDYVIIPDLRFDNELLYLKEAGYKTCRVHVTRPIGDPNMTDELKAHASENSLNYNSIDYVVENDDNIDALILKVFTVFNAINDNGGDTYGE